VIDTHAHLDPAEARETLERARAAGVGRVIAVATTIAKGHEALALADAHEGVYAALGVHPHEASGPDAGRLDELAELLAHPKAVAVGETGLDYYRDYAPAEAQHRLFDAQLDLASAMGKPVVIHSRAADADMLERLLAHEGPVVLHCFSSPGLLEHALERRWYVSFAGNMTYKNAPDLRSAAAVVPEDRLLAETDSPYLAPQPVRGRTNEPAFVVHVLAALAAVRQVEPAALAARIDANADALFGL
jgi:TatD DNase family protein